MNEQEFWFRYEDRRYAPPVDEFDRPIGEGSVEIILLKYPVIKYTPKGVWLDLSFNDHRFVCRCEKTVRLSNGRGGEGIVHRTQVTTGVDLSRRMNVREGDRHHRRSILFGMAA